MQLGNKTNAQEFFLLGLSDKSEQHPLLFAIFLCMHLIILTGNLLIILATGSDSHLHMAMYSFPSNLSFVDLCLTTNTIPEMLANIQSKSKSICYICCLTQMYFFYINGIVDSVLITVMAYECFVAICHPLHYTTIMSPCLCGLMVGLPWAVSIVISLAHTLPMFPLNFCASTELRHFFSDLTPLLQLACSDTTVNKILGLIVDRMVIVTPFLCILASYAGIVVSILKAPSAGGRKEAFSTCSFHLSLMALLYGTTIAVYLSPSCIHTTVKDKAFSVMYTVVTPTLNPFISSMCNKDLKGALKKLVNRKIVSSP
ncbi:olfactory receptor 24-like [Trichosurus vulpecula]|uniref:olfactory receptor 24-like n=1 Tax=Trichosurus vulpecula TaxID=9337 RepID=UPI00186B4635|nr:olfactory receptor 24-like [Trichosurus vulpecula]